MIISLLFIPLIGVLFLLPLGQQLLPLAPQPKSQKDSQVNQFNNINILNLPAANRLFSKWGKDNTINLNSNALMKKIALIVSLLNLLISIIMWFQFDNSSTNYQFVYEFYNLNFCHFHVGVDGISLYFVLLTTFITPICILSN